MAPAPVGHECLSHRVGIVSLDHHITPEAFHLHGSLLSSSVAHALAGSRWPPGSIAGQNRADRVRAHDAAAWFLYRILRPRRRSRAILLQRSTAIAIRHMILRGWHRADVDERGVGGRAV